MDRKVGRGGVPNSSKYNSNKTVFTYSIYFKVFKIWSLIEALKLISNSIF